MSDVMKKAEAILFAVGRAVSEQELSELTKESKHDIHEALVELKKKYEERDAPLVILDEGDSWKLTVHEKYISVVHQINPHTELSKSMLETLAVIAWKQPATQSEIVTIRTNKAYEHIAELEKMGYIAKHKHGRTFLIKVTGKFYDYFDLPGEHAVKDMFKDIKDVGEAQAKLEVPALGGLETFDVSKDEQVQEVDALEEPEKHLFAEEAEEKKDEAAEQSNFTEQDVEEELREEKAKGNTEEISENKEEILEEESEKTEFNSEETEQRALDPELEKFAEEKKKQ